MGEAKGNAGPPQLGIRGLLLWNLTMSCSLLPGSSLASSSSALIPTSGSLLIYFLLSVSLRDLLNVTTHPAKPLMPTLAAPAPADHIWE